MKIWLSTKNLQKNFARKSLQKLNIRWNCPTGIRLDTLDKELLRIMERSGCYSFDLGIESGSNRILRLMRKNITREKNEEKKLI